MRVPRLFLSLSGLCPLCVVRCAGRVPALPPPAENSRHKQSNNVAGRSSQSRRGGNITDHSAIANLHAKKRRAVGPKIVERAQRRVAVRADTMQLHACMSADGGAPRPMLKENKLRAVTVQVTAKPLWRAWDTQTHRQAFACSVQGLSASGGCEIALRSVATTANACLLTATFMPRAVTHLRGWRICLLMSWKQD